MIQIAITGAKGFLGWHTKCAAFAKDIGTKDIDLGDKFSLNIAVELLEQVDSVIHLAGVNRGTDEEVQQGNLLFAQQLIEAIGRCSKKPKSLIFANSIQANNGSVYGEAKKNAGQILQNFCSKNNIDFVDVLIPNVFGEHGKPFYNSVTSTFCHLIANQELPEVHNNKELTLVHAQDVADYLIGEISAQTFESQFRRIDVVGLHETIEHLSNVYSDGTIPDISDTFTKNMFNTYRSYLSQDQISFSQVKHSDSRGSFFEIVKVLGGEGQTSFSTTVPGVSRGDHFHRRKIERFTVLSGDAKIEMRKMFSNEVISFEVSGVIPVSVDMPTLWTHSIANTGDSNLFTSFWINEVFDPTNPDTYFETVQ